MKIFEFINNCRCYFDKIQNNKELSLTFIIGNQSADLGLAYYKYTKNLTGADIINYLPVLNTSLNLIKTKDECKYLFFFI
jgi:hypothetical protein